MEVIYEPLLHAAASCISVCKLVVGTRNVQEVVVISRQVIGELMPASTAEEIVGVFA